PPSLALALTHAAWVHVLRRAQPRRRAGRQGARSGIRIRARVLGCHRVGPAGRGPGRVRTRVGGRGAPAARHPQLLRHGRRQPHEVAYRALAVQGYARIGRLDDAHHELADAFDGLARHGERYFESELHRLKGELLLRRDRGGATGSPQAHADAERLFRSAIDIARPQRARSLELRAATSLSRLLRDQGRHAEAVEVLSGVYAGFTEGFDVLDLEEAAALLHVAAARAAPVA